MAEPMVCPGRSAFWLPVAGHLSRGERFSSSLKAWIYTTGEAEHTFWKLRRIFTLLLQGLVQDTSCDLALRRHRATVVSYFLQLYMVEDAELKPSRRKESWMIAKGELGEDFEDPYVREEFSISTKGLLSMLLAWWRERRYSRDQERGRALLTSFLGAVLTPEHIAELDLVQLWQESGGHCEFQTLDGTCLHFETVRGVEPSEDFACILAEQMGLMAKHMRVCGLARGTLISVLGFAEQRASTGIRSRACQQAAKISHPKGQQRLRRIDEDFKDNATSRLPALGRVRSAAAAVAVDDEVHNDAARDWSHQRIAAQLAAQWRLFGKEPLKGLVSLTLDGARIGNPGEETVVYAAWSDQHKEGCWCIPQALASATL